MTIPDWRGQGVGISAATGFNAYTSIEFSAFVKRVGSKGPQWWQK
jgi:hypothetical protein